MRRPEFLLLLGVALASCKSPTPEPAPLDRAAPAPAPAPAAPEAELEPAPEPDFLEVGGLHYIETVTGGASQDDPLPMIVAIHGLGDDPRNFVGLLADFDRPARVILPRAIDEWDNGGWSWFPVRARDQNPTGLARGIGEAATIIAAGVTELTNRRPTLGKPVVTGFSQGGMLTFELGVHHGELFSAAYPVGGWLPDPLWPESIESPDGYPQIVALHGDADPAVKIQPTRDAVAHLSKLGLAVELHEYPEVEHAIPPQMRGELHELLGAAVDRIREGP